MNISKNNTGQENGSSSSHLSDHALLTL